jgi:hypothetical protein
VPRRAINKTTLRGLINDGMQNIGPAPERERVTAVMCGVETLDYRLLIILPEVIDGKRRDEQK